MPIKDNTSYANLDRAIQDSLRRAEAALIRTLKWVGETVVTTARNVKTNTYKDRTGNLRSSVGAIISVDGRIEWQSSFNVVKGGGEGAKEGKEFARQLVAQYPKGIVLICVAGKNYAVHVSNRGLDVLDSAEIEARQLVPQMLKTLKF